MVFPAFVSKLKSFFFSDRSVAVLLAYAGTVAVFLWICSQFYLPGQGFTYLIEFGDQQHARYLPELKALNHFELHDSDGYDAQAYAQIAMRPRLGDPELRSAVDNLPYRARRILFCWTAYALAGGNAARALQIYAVQNILAWLLLAVLLCRWFPPDRWGHWLRWAAVLFSFGLCISVRGSLVDGPSLLLIAAGMALLESGRPWAAAALFGVTGLGKETNILAAASLAPSSRTGAEYRRAFGRVALALLPLIIWLLVLAHGLGGGGAVGARNFALPFGGYAGKWAEIARIATFKPWWMVRGSLLIQVALTAQWLFFALRPRWSDPWWRVGAAYAALMVVLGAAVWEDYPGAASRVLLPMTLAFNLLVPRGRKWWAVLILGNLSVLVTPDALPLPGRESFTASGPRALRIIPDSGRIVEAIFDARWFPPEKSWLEYWRWSRGAGSVTFRNPHPFPILAEISFGLRADDRRVVSVRSGNREYWRGVLTPNERRPVSIPEVLLPPGDTVWQFETDRPAVSPSETDKRELGFSLRNLKLDLKGP